ncbi:MAG TPA: tRNA (adenosine(37)-N6)-threonylcarbamoyltransferase complex dimerization subunit type 1 TsaB [Casimicrobiaceae bacterium]|jgi:tRNA threonylcarbamoyladenosine biosynthesis protein TsaB
MRIISFDTSTEWLSVAAGDGASWSAHLERAGPANSERILPAIDRVLADAGWRLTDLDGIAFGAGPGAFTGVRIACSVAQGLALGADLPVVAVPTLAAVAQEAWRDHQAARVFACLDARMREVYLAFHVRHDGEWRVEREPAVAKPADVELPVGIWNGEGDGFAAYRELALVPGVIDVCASTLPTARAIGELALPLFESGQGVPASEARPLYIRQRVALTTSERIAGVRL